MKQIFQSADILLPKCISDAEKAEKWAVIACDQFTSEPEYWEAVKDIVQDEPSTLRIILPEAFLTQMSEEKLDEIARYMQAYRKDAFCEYRDAMLLVRRTLKNGTVRSGIVGKIDLEAYDYSVGSVSPVRATEGTVLERIPPRVAVRRAASLETPHIMLLIDDPGHIVIESVDISLAEKLYDFDLMLDGGHVEGYLLSKEQQNVISSALGSLFRANASSLHYAVGDGNHSLASAKARYEELKAEIGDAAKDHPLRYALCEMVNLHDPALVFEPIYRLVKTDNKEDLLRALAAYGAACGEGKQTVTCLDGETSFEFGLGKGTHTLTVGTLQKFLDEYRVKNPDIEIDYIHGLDAIQKLSKAENTVGFVFEGMKKEELFSAVEADGALPRKTFSMGEAQEKRYYIECRDIT